MKKYQLGIMGLGHIFKKHYVAVKKNKNFSLVGLIDRNSKKKLKKLNFY